MTFRHGKTGSFKLGTAATPTVAADISTYLEEVSIPQKVDTDETTTFGAVAKGYVAGLPDGTISLKGKWDAAADAQFAAAIGLDTPLAWEHGPEGTTAGRVKKSGNAFITEYQTSTPVGGLITFTASLQITGVVTRATY